MQSIQVVFFGSENIDVGTTRLAPNTLKPIQKDQLNANVMDRYGDLIAWADMDDMIQYVGAKLAEVHMKFMREQLGWQFPTPEALRLREEAAKPKPEPEPTPEPEKAPEPEPAAPEPPPEPVKASAEGLNLSIPEPTATTTTVATDITTTETVDTDTVVLEKDDSEESMLADVFKDEDEPTIEPIEEKPKKKAAKKKGGKKKGGKKKGGKK